ncbi:MAG: DUF1549 domain-containing protein [Verrucomicrobiales bacterium]|nr:DUF1549 domain-containing protein [Verrucomicrobiales bacterium]
MQIRHLFPVFTTAIFGISPLASAAPDFEKDVKPIFEANCLRCHGSGKEKGDLRMHEKELFFKGGSSGDPMVVKGDPKASSLIDRITLPPQDDEIMPQEAEPLSPNEIKILTEWVESGAEWPEGVRLKTAKKVLITDAIPKGIPGSTVEIAKNIDELIKHENQNRKVEKADKIDDLAFLRRATVDLIGRIPRVQEVNEYLTWSPAERREKLVDKLLQDPRFTDRWTVFLADTLRVRSNATGGRELLAWVHTSVDQNEPWDRMAQELISASGRTTQNPAVGFLLNDNTDPMSMAAGVSQIFLGVRMSCAQCHDHPFDDWQQTDFYEMASFFGKTIQRQNQFARTTYTTEQEQNRVMWPPERENPPSREEVEPNFPFELAKFDKTPQYIARFEKLRAAEVEKLAKKDEGVDLDSLIDLDGGAKKKDDFDVLAEAKMASKDLKVHQDLYKPSELRSELAQKVTDPRNPYFARAFANRVWAELNGRGFVMPLDNFTEYQANSHPQTLEYISREFIASGYDMRELVRMIMLTDTYRRGHLPGDPGATTLEKAEIAFTASPVRRMLSEALFDSTVIAGHLESKKWRDGENVRVVSRQIRIPLGRQELTPNPEEGGAEMAMMQPGGNAAMASAGAGYSLEDSIEIDFKKVLADSAAQEEDLESMKAMEDAKIEAEKRRREAEEAARRRQGPQRYQLKTVEEKLDDNPSFNSTMRMASPAPADHFLRVFGQPSREGLGEFRDHSPSLRQQLMMLNGKATHEAARVGTLEPLFAMLSVENPDLEKAIKQVYLETLTREPDAEEMADAKAILTESETPLAGMSDLRWALLNCHEFRFLP